MTWEYIAGFFDGEGCLHLQRTGKRDKQKGLGYGNGAHAISIAQSGLVGLRVLSDIQTFVLRYGVKSSVRLDQVAGMHHRKKDSYLLRISARESTRIFLEHVFPHLVVKKTVAQDHLRYMRMYPSLRTVGSYMSEAQAKRKDSVRHKRAKICTFCGTPFVDNTTSVHVRTCSHSCAAKLMWKTRRAIKEAASQIPN